MGLSGTLSKIETLSGVLSPIARTDIEPLDITENGQYVAPKGSAYSPVTVNVPNPSTGTIDISVNGNYDVTAYAEASVSVPNTYTSSDENKVVHNGVLTSQTSTTKTENGAYDTTLNNEVVINVQPPLEAKTATPAKQSQVIEPTSPNYGLSRVTVEPIPNEYIVPDGVINITSNGIHDVTTKASADVQVRQPSGAKSITITQNGTQIEDVEWYEDANISVNVPNSYTASDEGKVVSNGGLIGQTSRSITANGTFDTTLNDEVVVSVPNPSSGTLSITQNGIYDVTEKASADVNVKPTLLRGIMRPDAELVKTYSYDKWIVADEGVTLPSYSTALVTLKATEQLDSLTMDADYDYFVIERFLSIPTYSINTKNKGRSEYTSTINFYEVTRLGVHKALIDNTIADLNIYQTLSLGGGTQQVYFTSTNVLSVYPSSSYGIGQAAVPISVGNTNNRYLRINSPNMNIRGYTNYLTQEYYDALTDIRYQYVIDVWRAPKDNLNLDAWMGDQELWHVNECAESANHKLT